mmetsp:Transcript_19042/g.45767  ORF Transcript_19042/g.45767 Transcript_19042/m.45767 type:complete len:239 (+) Transcript_19042:430-1146(+)
MTAMRQPVPSPTSLGLRGDRCAAFQRADELKMGSLASSPSVRTLCAALLVGFLVALAHRAHVAHHDHKRQPRAPRRSHNHFPRRRMPGEVPASLVHGAVGSGTSGALCEQLLLLEVRGREGRGREGRRQPLLGLHRWRRRRRRDGRRRRRRSDGRRRRRREGRRRRRRLLCLVVGVREAERSPVWRGRVGLGGSGVWSAPLRSTVGAEWRVGQRPAVWTHMGVVPKAVRAMERFSVGS